MVFSSLLVASGVLGLEPHHPVSDSGSAWHSSVCLSPNLSILLEDSRRWILTQGDLHLISFRSEKTRFPSEVVFASPGG